MVEENDLNYREKIDIKTIFMQQLSRCLINSGDVCFTEHVESLLSLLPIDSFTRIIQQTDMYDHEITEFVYEEDFGHQLGTPTNPALYDPSKPVKRLENGEIDWTDENIRSPKLETKNITDFQKLFRIIISEAQLVGLIWDIDQETLKADTVRTVLQAKKTPHRGESNE